MHPVAVLMMMGSAAWFLVTLALAVRAARARLYAQHQVWMLRHLAAGLW